MTSPIDRLHMRPASSLLALVMKELFFSWTSIIWNVATKHFEYYPAPCVIIRRRRTEGWLKFRRQWAWFGDTQEECIWRIYASRMRKPPTRNEINILISLPWDVPRREGYRVRTNPRTHAHLDACSHARRPNDSNFLVHRRYVNFRSREFLFDHTYSWHA